MYDDVGQCEVEKPWMGFSDYPARMLGDALHGIMRVCFVQTLVKKMTWMSFSLLATPKQMSLVVYLWRHRKAHQQNRGLLFVCLFFQEWQNRDVQSVRS